MPKLFAIQIEVEEIAVGKVMRQLSKMPGVAKLNLDIEHKPNGSVRGPYKKHGAAPKEPRKRRGHFAEGGTDVIGSALFAKSPLTTAQLREVFIKGGRSPKSLNSQLHKAKTTGEIEATAEGWVLTRKMRDRLRHRKASK